MVLSGQRGLAIEYKKAALLWWILHKQPLFSQLRYALSFNESIDDASEVRFDTLACFRVGMPAFSNDLTVKYMGFPEISVKKAISVYIPAD